MSTLSTEFRAATSADVERLAQIHVDAWNATYTGLVDQAALDERTVGKRIDEWNEVFTEDKWSEHDVYVVEEGGRVTGFAWVGPSDDRDVDRTTTLNVFALYLDPTFTGKGRGTQLLEHVLRVARNEGYVRATLYVLIGNERARRFYEQRGWTPEPDVVTDCLGDGAYAPQLRYTKALV